MIYPKIDKASIDSISNAIVRAHKETNRTRKDALKWGGYTLAVALAKRTKVAPKFRKVVTQGQVKRSKGVKAQAGIKGVIMFKAGKEVFVPFATGNVQYRQFTGRGGVPMVQVFPSRKYYTQDEFNAMSSLRLKGSVDIVNIKRAGMAKESWLWMSRNTGRSSSTNMHGVSNVGATSLIERENGEISLTLNSKLNYMIDALKGGWSSVNEAVYKAGRAMEIMMNKGITQALKV